MHWHALPPRRVTAVRNFVVNTGFSRSAKGSMKTPPTHKPTHTHTHTQSDVRSDLQHNNNNIVVTFWRPNFKSRVSVFDTTHYVAGNGRRSPSIRRLSSASTCRAAVSVSDNRNAIGVVTIIRYCCNNHIRVYSSCTLRYYSPTTV